MLKMIIIVVDMKKIFSSMLKLCWVSVLNIS